MAIGEILLGALFQVLFEKMASMGSDYVQRQGALHFPGISINLLNKWNKDLKTIYEVLDDAEDKQLSGKGLVKLWLDDVRDLAYDMEDLLDEIAIEAARAKLEAKASTSRGMVPFLSQLKSSISNLNQHSLVSKSEVHKINDRLEKILTKMDNLILTKNATNGSDDTNKRLSSTSLPELCFLGRGKEEEEILELLTGEVENDDTSLSIVLGEVENDDTTLGIVPIVGMGGVGKTALAQRLYNDVKVSSCFDGRAWVCVSYVFDVLNITRTILRSITGLSNEGEDLNEFQVKLKDSLSGKKFLIVLDDVWKVTYEEWTVLLKPFKKGAKGSKIIITTRNHSVVSITGASAYHLKELSLNSCTSLLVFHALGEINYERDPKRKKICEKIGEKCKGSPLAAKVLGGILRGKGNPNQWEAIFNSKMWDLLIGENDEVRRVLKLSYVHLPSYLKRCFVYCAIFPEDYEIERDELVLLWIAEGLLDRQKAKENVLELGRIFFDELLSRSFLQQSSVDASKFSMHDHLNDLAKSIASGTSFNFGESQLAGNEGDAPLERARYASFSTSMFVTPKCIETCDQMKVLRSLMFLYPRCDWENQFHISNKVLNDLLAKLKYLRVFSLHHCSIVEVPNCIGDLKHLRYLNFSYTNIKRLPESIGTLYKLRALILRGCEMLSTLPPCITKLVSLQFLDIKDTKSLKEMPLGIGNLKNLAILSKFVVGLKKGSPLKELKNLLHLQGELFISELQKVEAVTDAVDANLFGKQGLSNLILHWGEDFGMRNHEREAQVIHSLRPHTNLENLTISYYGGATFPSWLDGPSYYKMGSLCLRDCPKVTLLPSLGQLPSLKELSLEGLHAISMIGSEFYGDKGSFPSLSTLKFKEMRAWKNWSHYVGAVKEDVPFSCLRHLIVQSCPLLLGTLPCQLDNLMKLEIHSCQHLKNSTGVLCLPSLHELYLKDCNKEILERLVNLTSLSNLKIEELAELFGFDHGFMSSLIKLKELHIVRCNNLNYLWQDGNEMQNLTCLQSIVINRCPQFTSFMAKGEIELPCNLERMELRDCMSLEKLPSKMHTLKNLIIKDCPKLMGVTIPLDDPISNNPESHLESLYIEKCDSLTSFPFARGRLAALKTLEIWDCKGVKSLEEIVVESLNSLLIFGCENLGSLPQCLHTLSHLTRLEIIRCPALEMDFLPLPVTLSSLILAECPKMKSIASYNIASCSNLTELKIWGCPALEIADFPPLPITLSELAFWDCPKIKSLPSRLHQFTSLRELFISNCQNIKCFPKGGLPPNLQWLHIKECENMKQPMREWGLPLLTSLKWLDIDGRSMGGEGDKVWFPSQDDKKDAWSLLFPSSLTDLELIDMKNLERLSSGLRNHLSSLKLLEIRDCPKLRNLPKDGFPPSLQQLDISGCEILKDRYLKFTSNHRLLIQKIPLIHIDRDRIQ